MALNLLNFLKRRRKKVVIVGAGFGGIAVAKELLGKAPGVFSITIVDKNDYHLFQPGLLKAAATFVEPSRIFSAVTINLKEIFGESVTIVKNEAKDIIFDKNQVLLRGDKIIDYDYLIIAAGAETDFKEIDGAEKYATPLKTFEDALRIKSRLEEVIKNKAKREPIEIAVVGAGSTGCELAAELISYVKKLSEIYGHPQGSAKIRLIEAADTILPMENLWLRKKTEKRLADLGIEISVKSHVKSVKENEITLKDGGIIHYDVLLWATGAKPNRLVNGSVLKCDSALRVHRQKDVFAVGDIVCRQNSTLDIQGLTVQETIHRAKYVARAIIGLNRIFVPLIFWRQRKKGTLVDYKPIKPKLIMTLGDRYGLVDLGILKLAAKPAYLLKHFIYLNYFTGILPWRKAFTLYKNFQSL